MSDRARCALLREALDRTAEPPALRDALQHRILEPLQGQFVHDRRDTRGVQTYCLLVREEAGIPDLNQDVDDPPNILGKILDEIIADIFSDCAEIILLRHVAPDQRAFADQLVELRRDVLAAIPDDGPGPALSPYQPPLAALLPADEAQAEKVIQSAAIDTCDDHLASGQQIVQRQGGDRAAVPEVGADPAIVGEPGADLDVEVLREKYLKLAGIGALGFDQFLGKPFGVDRAADVRVGDIEVCRIAVCPAFDHRWRELVEHP